MSVAEQFERGDAWAAWAGTAAVCMVLAAVPFSYGVLSVTFVYLGIGGGLLIGACLEHRRFRRDQRRPAASPPPTLAPMVCLNCRKAQHEDCPELLRQRNPELMDYERNVSPLCDCQHVQGSVTGPEARNVTLPLTGLAELAAPPQIPAAGTG